MRQALRLIIVFLVLFGITLSADDAVVTNKDKPLKGDWDFKPEKIWEVGNAGDSLLVEIRQFRVDDAGRVYVLEGKQLKIHVFSPEGKHLFSFGQKGEGPGEFKFIFTFFLLDDLLIVPDMGRFHYFEKKNGNYLKTIALQSSGMFPRAFIDKDRFLTIAPKEDEKSEIDKVVMFDLNTKQRSPVAQIGAEKPTKMESNTGGRRMSISISDSSLNPTLVLYQKGDMLYLAKSDHYLVKAIGLKGKKKFSFSLEGRIRKKVSEEYKKSRLDGIVLNGMKLPPDMKKQMIAGTPDIATYFSGIDGDDKGNIYVFPSDPGNNSSSAMDVFSPKGKYLYRAVFRAPEGYTLNSGITIKGDYLYTVLNDDEDEPKVVKFKINKI